MKKALKISGLTILIYFVIQLITIPITKHGRGFSIGFPFQAYRRVDAECYVSNYFYPEFLIINFITVTIILLVVYFLSNVIKNRLKKSYK